MHKEIATIHCMKVKGARVIIRVSLSEVFVFVLCIDVKTEGEWSLKEKEHES